MAMLFDELDRITEEIESENNGHQSGNLIQDVEINDAESDEPTIAADPILNDEPLVINEIEEEPPSADLPMDDIQQETTSTQ
jgi:hypothetical protein